MRWPFVLRSRHDAEMAGLNADRDRLRAERDEALEGEATAKYNRGQVFRQLAAADAANRRLAGRNLELGNRLSTLTEADPEYAAALEARLDRALTACARYLDALWSKQHLADALQARLDDACGLNAPAVLAGSGWQSTRHDKKRTAS